MPELIAIAYTEETVAAQAAAELARCAAEITLDPDAVGVIVAEKNGNHQLLTSRHPGATAAWSRFWGVIFSVVMNEEEASGLDLGVRQQAGRGTFEAGDVGAAGRGGAGCPGAVPGGCQPVRRQALDLPARRRRNGWSRPHLGAGRHAGTGPAPG